LDLRLKHLPLGVVLDLELLLIVVHHHALHFSGVKIAASAPTASAAESTSTSTAAATTSTVLREHRGRAHSQYGCDGAQRHQPFHHANHISPVVFGLCFIGHPCRP
jgi:hypothetical protein